MRRITSIYADRKGERKKNPLYVFHFFGYLLLSSLFFSCVADEHEIKIPDTKEEERELLVTIQIPGTNVPITYRDISETEENEIRTLDVLVFCDGKGDDYFYKHVSIPALTEDNGTVKSFKMKLKSMDAKLVVLANVHDLFTPAMEDQLSIDSLHANVSKEIIMRRFVFSYTYPKGESRMPFPMYGESEAVSGEVSNVDEIRMTRSVARIDIGIADNCPFTIDSVYIFNSKDKGYVSPSFSQSGSILEEPWVPHNAVPYASPIGYAFKGNSLKGNTVMMERTIYITEDTQRTNKPTVVVVKVVQPNTTPVYYRIHMQEPDESFIPIRRNYRYKICIIDASETGYSSAKEAAEATASLHTVIESNELDIREIVVDETDRYMLGVSTSEVVFNADGTWAEKNNNENVYILKIHTTYPRWTASWNARDFEGWLTLPGNSNENGIVRMENPSSIRTILIKPTTNNTEKERSGSITLTAGTLTLEVKLIQKGKSI